MKLPVTMLALASGLALSASAANAAPVIDAFASFDGTQGAGGFSYGDLSNAGKLSLYTANSNCFITGSTCLQRSANHDVPGATKSTTTSFQYNTVDVPDDQLLLHPENGPALTAAIFTAASAGTYIVNGTFETVDRYATGVDLFLLNNGPASTYGRTAIGSLGVGSSLSYTTKVTLAKGQAIGFGIGNAGFYGNDSTGVNFSVSSVPEPATWSMMIVGFGAIGFVMRRRTQTTVRYA